MARKTGKTNHLDELVKLFRYALAGCAIRDDPDAYADALANRALSPKMAVMIALADDLEAVIRGGDSLLVAAMTIASRIQTRTGVH